ncbi:Mtc5p Ecym_4280 [Eremothecium cymbalariae DBVPG|uniref:RWD domain-containing protein n=1 Tax=Eremothecium cymbalariae (strain CBS 270.75 / DBVPG 7215 / KCTC 17166 / NRRL Y-17582) TaxID=931890 RepID=G8JTJ1_ERECY|nr:hypothetical protein Ecym_4280 [Eremothecium cymbalariae DBVPG\
MSKYVGGDPYQSPTFGQSLSLRVDGGFNAVSINPSGRDVVLASRTGLYVVDLDDPFSPPRWLQHITPWQVADIQWSPHPSKPHWVVSTSNQKALVWNLSRTSSNAIEYELHGHFRAITDINFHPSHPELLATCSIDTYVHAWDMRSPQRPYYSTSDWSAGASQVKWNLQNANVLASSHANSVFIWDIRKGCTPLYKLSGNNSSVNNIDFNKVKENEIMSSSNDGTVKFWDYSKSSTEPLFTIKAEFPVWRGRYLPFGDGCCIMPMVGGNNSIYLINNSWRNEISEEKEAKLQPIYVFKGHSNIVTDFLWRSRHSYGTEIDDTEYQLVTWSKDCDLRLWPVAEATYEKLNFKRGQRLHEKLPEYEYNSYGKSPEKTRSTVIGNYKAIRENFVTNSGLQNAQQSFNHLDWVSGVKMNHSDCPHDFFSKSTLQNLGEEVSQVGHKFRRITFERISVSTGELVLTLNGPWVDSKPDEYTFIRIEIKFPENYPAKGHPPVFKIEENTELTTERRNFLVSRLKEITEKYAESGSYCLEPCLRFLLGENVDLEMLDNEVNEEYLLNLDMVDEIGDEYSSIQSSQDNMDLSDMTASEDEDISGYRGGNANKNKLAHDTTFDSTPVPKGCGAVWTPTGQLLCFFVSQPERKSQYMWMVGNRGKVGGIMKINDPMTNAPEPLYGDVISHKIKRPKRYVEILYAPPYNRNEPGQIDNDSDSNESDDSIADDWSDILKNDITLRTKMPVFYTNFKNPMGSIQSESVRTNDSKVKPKNVIVLHDFSHLIPDKIALAKEYRLIGDSPEALARHNVAVAEKNGNDELAQCWYMIVNLLLSRDQDNVYNFGWDEHPLGGRWLVKEIMRYFEQTKNVQMLAMLACVLVDPKRRDTKEVSQLTSERKNISENTITFHDDYYKTPYSYSQSHMFSDFTTTPNTTSELAIQQVKLRYTNDSASIPSDDYFNGTHNSRAFFGSKSRSSSAFMFLDTHPPLIPEVKIEILHDEILDLISDRVPSLLDPEDEPIFRRYRRQYAELLYYWGLPMERVKVLKFNINENTEPEILSCMDNSKNRKEDYYGGIGFKWIKKSSFTSKNCTYCGLKTKRRILVCGNCQHILHASCAVEWWQLDEECPSGCGCYCPKMFNVN